MTISIFNLLYNDPELSKVLKQLYSYDPRLGVITYIGPSHHPHQPKHIDRDGYICTTIPTHGTPPLKFLQVRSRHLAWRLSLPDNEPMPNRLFRRKEAPGLDLKLASFTTDTGAAKLGRGPSKGTYRPPLPAKWVEPASKDERVRALIASEAEVQMKDYIRRLMLLHPPLQTAWAQAKAIYEGKAMTNVTPQRDGETHAS